MEDMTIRSLEKSLRGKILLYSDLLQCFKEEKDALINVDLDKLWRISKEKEKLCLKIDVLRKRIVRDLCHESDQPHFTLSLLVKYVSEIDRKEIYDLYYMLQVLKGEIDTARKENIRVADYSLRFLDEILSTIIGESHQTITYNSRCRLGHSGRDMFLSREI